jgi:hypothetical protein
MAKKLVLKDASVEIDGVDLSDHVTQVTIEDTADEVDVTGMQQPYREFDVGLKDATITITFISDFEAGSVDATLAPLYAGDEEFDAVIKPRSGAVSATNPSFTQVSKLYGYSPIAGNVGEASTTDVPLRNAGPDGIVRAVS